MNCHSLAVRCVCAPVILSGLETLVWLERDHSSRDTAPGMRMIQALMGQPDPLGYRSLMTAEFEAAHYLVWQSGDVV